MTYNDFAAQQPTPIALDALYEFMHSSVADVMKIETVVPEHSPSSDPIVKKVTLTISDIRKMSTLLRMAMRDCGKEPSIWEGSDGQLWVTSVKEKAIALATIELCERVRDEAILFCKRNLEVSFNPAKMLTDNGYVWVGEPIMFKDLMPGDTAISFELSTRRELVKRDEISNAMRSDAK